MRWTDEMKVDEAKELLSFSVGGESISIQEIKYEGEPRFRVSVGTLFGSQSVHLKTLADAVGAASKAHSTICLNTERENFGKAKKVIDATKLPGFLMTEPREAVSEDQG